MLAQQRQQAIHEMVQRLGGVRVGDLVREFGVSDMTIRRDLEALAERGLVAKVHGGATTTTCMLANLLLDVPGLTVVTNSVPVADVFYKARRADQMVVLTGGIRTPSDALVGPFAVNAIRSLNVDMLFMGVHGMSTHAGFTTPNLMEAETDRALVSASRRLVVVADHTKWELVGISTIAALHDAHTLISDSGLSGGARDALVTEVGELVIAD
ncbi:MAG: DeoR family transcriptional regulator [Actinobacteria bacterium 13_2_20CM_2_72_6]|nr:MAG: DeoR family transcriptional regulator [Actinobacteria bacterium 13_2_20CM_2_72_6]